MLLTGRTEQPSAGWVTPQARNLNWELSDAGMPGQLVLRDRDSKYPPAFNALFTGQGVRVVYTPIPAPGANAPAARWAGTVRRDCLDQLLFFGRASRAGPAHTSVTRTRPGHFGRCSWGHRWHPGSPSHRVVPSDAATCLVVSSTSMRG